MEITFLHLDDFEFSKDEIEVYNLLDKSNNYRIWIALKYKDFKVNNYKQDCIINEDLLESILNKIRFKINNHSIQTFKILEDGIIKIRLW